MDHLSIQEESGWDKRAVMDIMSKVPTISHPDAMVIVGLIAEHRQRAYMQGVNRGYENGWERAKSKFCDLR